jgi:PAS domain S-box-containing protein
MKKIHNFLFTNKIINTTNPATYWWGTSRFFSGDFFFLAVLSVSLPLFLSLYFAIYKYLRLKSGILKSQLKYIIIGLSIPIFFGVITDLIFPLFDIVFIPLADFLIIFTVLFFSYAIYRWNALDISLGSFKIKNKIFIPIFIATFILSVVTGFVIYYYSSKSVETEVDNYLENISLIEAERVNNYMDSHKEDVQSLSYSPLLQDFFNAEINENVYNITSDIKKDATNVAAQISEYLKDNPQATLADLQKDPNFQEIAVQPVGKTGYTAVTDYDSLIARFHKSPSTVDLDLHLLADKLPGFWSIMSKTKGGQRAEGFYDWLESDGRIEQKYMDIEIVDRRTADGVGLSVAATTYIDEYGYDLANFKKVITYLKSYKNSHDFLDLLIVNKQGNVILSTENKIKYGENLNSSLLNGGNLQLAFASILDGNKLAFSDKAFFQDSLINKSPYLASAIYDSNSGELLGVLALEVDLSKINKLFYLINTSGSGFSFDNMYLIGRDLIVRASSEFNENATYLDKIDNVNAKNCFQHSFLSEKQIGEKHKKIEEFKNIKGELSLGAHSYISDYDWCILTEVDKKMATSSSGQLLLVFLISGFFYLVIFYFIISFISKIISDPIDELQSEIEKIEKGDLNRSVKVISKDEIGKLSHAFNKMIVAVRKSRENLDKKVREQTADIVNKTKDLTEQRSAILNILEDVEEERDKNQEEKEKIYTILHSIGDGVFVVDKNLRVALINHMVERISGFNSGEIMGKRYDNVLNFIREVDRKKLKNDFITKVMREKRTQKMPSNTMLIRKNGEIIPVADSAAPLRDKNNRVIGCVVVFRDITKEYQIDKAKTEFVSLASHQLRTPLSAINWYAEMLLSGDAGKLNKDQESFIKEIYIGNQRMVELVNALLNVSRIELGTLAIDPKTVDFKEISRNVIKELKGEIETKKIKVKESYSRGLPKIKADPNLSRIILQNIITNAVKYTPEKGTVSVLLKKDEENLIIQISDTGYGIPKDQQDKIFQKLFRADNVREKDTGGTGLGLYLVKSILEQSGGKVWFCRRGDGSRRRCRKIA